MSKKEAAEPLTEYPITNEEYQKALRAATDKLDRINKRYGTNHGDDYLAMLIAEQVQFNRFSQHCNAMYRVGQAKKKGAPESAPIPNHQYYITHGILCQEGFLNYEN